MAIIKKVRRRTGQVIPFDAGKIQSAIEKAMAVVGEFDSKISSGLTKEVVDALDSNVENFDIGIPDVEQIQEQVEEVLSNSKLQRTAKAYMLYRRSRGHARELKNFFGIKDDLKFDVNAIRVLQERYLKRDERGRIAETPTELFIRVAKAVASAETKESKKWEYRFFEMMKNLEFLPNSPTLMNAGTKLGQLSACFVLPVNDSLEEIFDTLKYMAMIQQSGGGTGFSFSRLRPKGDIVKSTSGIASGPVSFIKIFDATTEVIKQGGKRRGANMGILDANHPDILEFAISKQNEKQLSNFNISVAADDNFMKAVENGGEYPLINPHTGEIMRKISAKNLFELICSNSWETGDPGMIFIDEINRKNQVPGAGRLEATNPCGEVPLLPYESCNLGSINLTKIIKDGKIDFGKLTELVHNSVRFLDNVIEINRYPFPELKEMALANRRIGLGVMGFAEMLIMMDIPYDSPKAIETSEKIMSHIQRESIKASQELGKQKGNFPNFDKSIWKGKAKNMRNCACTTIAPTGTISIIAGCSSGIEPIFALAFMREVLAGKHLFEMNKVFQNELVKNNLYSEDIANRVAVEGNLKKTRLPEKFKRLFKTALEIPFEQHIKIQSAFQKYTDNAVSKTINLPNDATIEDVQKAYMLAYRLKCKGITIYRYGSKKEQVLYLGSGKKYSKATNEFSGGSCVGSVCTF